jgi:hypothetical protein
MISDERLEQFAHDKRMCNVTEEIASMAKELLALRKAFSEPFCFTDNAGIDLWHMSESFEVWPEREGDISIPLFRKPVID